MFLLPFIMMAIVIGQVKKRNNQINNMRDFLDPDLISNRVSEIFGNVTGTMGNNVNADFRATNSVADATLAKIAICYYIAKADGVLSREEQIALDGVVGAILNSPSLPRYYRDEIKKISEDKTNSFLFTEQYLNKVNPEVLISFLDTAKAIATADNQLSSYEQQALSVFEEYLSGKTGCSYESNKSAVDTKCECCGGTMKPDYSTMKLNCPYCGNARLFRM